MIVQLKLWGTRGSLPQALSRYEFVERIEQLIDVAERKGISDLKNFKESLRQNTLVEVPHFGGHTTCTEVIHGGEHLLVDAGSGITDACVEALGRGQKQFHILQTHMHWDHIMGLPFFVPIYQPGTEIIIHHVHANTPEYVKILFNGINFPVKWQDLSAKISFHLLKLYEPIEFGAITVTPFALDHPGGSFGYHFEANGRKASIGVDGEYKRLTAKELGKDLKFYQDIDVLLFDGQYELDELATRFDWGHSSPPIGVELALREGIKRLILCHHDPRATAEKAQRMLEQARQYCKDQLPHHKEAWAKRGQPEGPRIESGYDGLEIDLDRC
jgi:phosphoribosyl 1,2-cyclic phosphodiesterase